MSEEATLDEFAREDESEEQRQKWRKVELHEVAYKRSDNVDPQEAELEKHVGLEHIDPDNPVPDWEPLDDLSSTKRRFETGDVLFAKLRPNLEKSAQPDFEGVASTDIFPIVAESGINSKWLLYRLSSKPAYDYARRTSAGTRMPRTSWSLFSNFEFGLPPLSEQRKITAILYTIDQNIQKLREITLQSETVKEGIFQEKILDKISKSPSPTALGELPENWERVKLEDVASEEKNSLVDGPFGSSLKSEEFVADGYARVIQLQNVKPGRYDDSNVRYVDARTYSDLERHSAEPGDIYIAKMASPVARACILPDDYERYMLGCADVVKLEPSDEFIDEFVMHMLNSYPVWKQAAAHIRGSGRLRVNLNQLKEVELPKPPLEEQKRVVDAVESVADSIEEYKKEKQNLKRLKRGLMQDLLRRKVRTSNTDIEVPEEIIQYG